MNIILISELIGMIGKVLLGIAVYRVHGRVVKEHKIDKAVLSEMRGERWITLIGIALIILEFAIKLSYHLDVDILGLYS